MKEYQENFIFDEIKTYYEENPLFKLGEYYGEIDTDGKVLFLIKANCLCRIDEDLFAIQIGNKWGKLIIKYSEEGRYTRKNGSKLKMLTDYIIVNKHINEDKLCTLDKYFQKCYLRYKAYSEQKLYASDFIQNQTNLLQELQEQWLILQSF